jgi:hypothetical protein
MNSPRIKEMVGIDDETACVLAWEGANGAASLGHVEEEDHGRKGINSGLMDGCCRYSFFLFPSQDSSTPSHSHARSSSSCFAHRPFALFKV